MSRAFQYVNLAGVLALGALCVVQWKRDRDLNFEVNRLEKTRIAHEETIADQEKSILGLKADLDLFKQQLTTARSELTDTRDQLHARGADLDRLTLERDQLRESITNWMEAVALRDERLKEANASIQDLADRLNESIAKFNELATNYNSVVEELNGIRTQGTNSARR